MSPFRFCLPKLNDLLVFPTGTFRDVYLCKSELELLDDLDCRYRIRDAHHIFNNDPRLWIEEIEELYEKRKLLKREGNRLQFVYKTFLSCLYGVCIQENKGKVYLNSWTEEDELEGDLMTLEDGRAVLVKSIWKAGAWFNPLLACEITARTRCKLFRDFFPYQDHMLMLATDSASLDIPIPFKSSEKLGGYEVYEPTQGVILGNGIYQFSNGKRGKRGLMSDRQINLLELFQDNLTDEIYLTKRRPKGLKEGKPSLRARNASEITIPDRQLTNMFLQYTKKVDINMDKKRRWLGSFPDFNSVLEEKIDSLPLHLHF
jgi:hypothetical protein